MIDLQISIGIKDDHDLEIVIEAIKAIAIEKPVYILNYGDSYNIRYETDQNIEGIESALYGKFPNYSRVDNVDVGQTNIKIIITITQSPFSTDNWGRRFNSDPISTTYYYIEEGGSENEVIPGNNLRVLFGDEEKSYEFYVTYVIHRTEPDNKGFIVTKTPFKKDERQDLLSDELFASPRSAYWAGYRKLESTIEAEYNEFVNANKKKRKKKADK